MCCRIPAHESAGRYVHTIADTSSLPATSALFARSAARRDEGEKGLVPPSWKLEHRGVSVPCIPKVAHSPT
jgi:hypothetical protein